MIHITHNKLSILNIEKEYVVDVIYIQKQKIKWMLKYCLTERKRYLLTNYDSFDWSYMIWLSSTNYKYSWSLKTKTCFEGWFDIYIKELEPPKNIDKNNPIYKLYLSLISIDEY